MRYFNCLLFRSVDLQTDNIYFDISVGFAEPAEAVGEDDVVPEASGRDEGMWRKDRRRIILEGHVRGTGETVEQRQQSWRFYTDALMATMDRSISPGELEVIGPYLGLSPGQSATLNARCVNTIAGPVRGTMNYQSWSIELICFDSPPDWTVEAS